MKKRYGYFDDEYQSEPAFDPGLGVDCPVCNHPLSAPMMTVSLMLPGDSRSYFFRAHRECWQGANPDIQTNIESMIIDAVASAQNRN